MTETRVLGGETNLLPFRSFHYQSHMDWLEIEPGPPRRETLNASPNYVILNAL